jgi:hypothetical protein
MDRIHSVKRNVHRLSTADAVSIQPITRSNGDSAVSVKVDYSQIPAPDAYYVADYARIGVKDCTVQFVFGKLEGDLPRLRNKLEVRIPPYAFMGQWMSSLTLIDELKKYMDKLGYPSYATPVGVEEMTDKVQTVHANNVLISGGESECSIDLYLLPPRDLRFYLEKRETPHLEPLVRILTEGRILVGLGQKFREVAEEIQQFAPSREEIEQADAMEITL